MSRKIKLFVFAVIVALPVFLAGCNNDKCDILGPNTQVTTCVYEELTGK